MNRTFDSLKYPNYRLWFWGGLVSNIGTWMQRIAQTWLVLAYLSDDSGTAVGIVIGLQFAPVLVLTPYAGLLADRLNRRHFMQVTSLILALVSFGLGALVLAGVAALWHVYAFALLLGVTAALESPNRMTLVSELVPPESLSNAVGLNATSFNTARLVGPALAGALIAVVGPGWVFLLTGLTLLVPVFTLGIMKAENMYAAPSVPRGKGQLREGIAYTRSRPDILVIMAVMAVVGALGLNFQLTTSVMARQVFGLGSGEFGIINTVMGIGALSGALMAARRSRPRLRTAIGGALLFGFFMLLSGLAPTFWLYVVLNIPVGYFSTTMMNTANAYIQLATSPVFRGRVMSLYLIVFMGSTPIASPFIGWVAEALGGRWAVAIGGGASMLAAGAAMIWAWRRLKYRVRYRLHQRPYVEILGPDEPSAAEEAAAEEAAAEPEPEPEPEPDEDPRSGPEQKS